MARCRFTKRDGSPCKGAATGSNGGCWAHDADYALERKRIARMGGKGGGRGRPRPGSADLVRLQKAFENLAEQVLTGQVDRGNAAVAIQAWGGARSCVVASLKARETEEFEERLAALEAEQQGLSSSGSVP
jgi:hypothetical protein